MNAGVFLEDERKAFVNFINRKIHATDKDEDCENEDRSDTAPWLCCARRGGFEGLTVGRDAVFRFGFIRHVILPKCPELGFWRPRHVDKFAPISSFWKDPDGIFFRFRALRVVCISA